MAFLKFGQEGETLANQHVLNVTYADVDHRGGVPFELNEFAQFSFGSQPEIWYHGKVYLAYPSSVPNSSSGKYEFFSVKDAAGKILISAYSLRLSNPDQHQLRFVAISNDAGSLTTLFHYGDIPVNIEMVFDYHVKLTGLTMEIVLYLNGSIIATRTVAGVAPVWGQPAMASYGHYGPGAGTSQWHEIGVSDTPTVGVGLSTLEATGAGFHTSAAGSYPDVSEVGIDLTTTISLPNIGDKESWIIEPLAGKTFGASSVQNIMLSALVVDTGGAVTGYRYFIRSGGVDYPTAGGTHTPTGLMTNFVEEVSINPVTGNAFTTVEIAAGIEIGIEGV